VSTGSAKPEALPVSVMEFGAALVFTEPFPPVVNVQFVGSKAPENSSGVA